MKNWPEKMFVVSHVEKMQQITPGLQRKHYQMLDGCRSVTCS